MNLLWEVNSYSRVALSSDVEQLSVSLGILASPKEPLELYNSIAPLIISPRTPSGAGTRVHFRHFFSTAFTRVNTSVFP